MVAIREHRFPFLVKVQWAIFCMVQHRVHDRRYFYFFFCFVLFFLAEHAKCDLRGLFSLWNYRMPGACTIVCWGIYCMSGKHHPYCGWRLSKILLDWNISLWSLCLKACFSAMGGLLGKMRGRTGWQVKGDDHLVLRHAWIQFLRGKVEPFPVYRRKIDGHLFISMDDPWTLVT